MKKYIQKHSRLTIIVAAIACMGYLVYKYAYLVYQDYDYYTYYTDVHGLQRSSPVIYNGVRIGEVSGIAATNGSDILVTISIDKRTKIPKGSVAMLASTGILGERLILLNPGDGPGIYRHRDTIQGRYDSSIMDFQSQAEPAIESAKYILNTADKSFTNFKTKLEHGWVTETRRKAAKVESAMRKLMTIGQKVDSLTGNFTQSLREVSHQTDIWAKKSTQLTSTLEDAERGTSDMAEIRYKEQLDTIRSIAASGTKSIVNQTSSAKAKELLDNKKSYQDASDQLGNLQQNLNNTIQQPTPISIIGGD